MSLQQYLVGNSYNFTKQHKFAINLGIFGLCGGIISFLMYLGFDSLLNPLQKLLIGLLSVEQLNNVFVLEQNINKLGVERAIEFYGANLDNVFLGPDLVPYVFMGFAIVTLVYIGQLFYSTNISKLKWNNLFKVMKIGLISGVIGGTIAIYVEEAVIRNLLPIASLFGVDTLTLNEITGEERILDYLRAFIQAIRLIILSSVTFFALNFIFQIKRIWQAITICVILNLSFFAWIRPDNSFVLELYFSLFFATVVGVLFAKHIGEQHLREKIPYSNRFKFLKQPSLVIIGISLLIVIIALPVYLYIFYFLNDFQDCEQIFCAVKAIGGEIGLFANKNVSQ